MMKYLLTFAALLSFAVLPAVAQDDAPADSENSTTLSPDEIKAQKKAAKAAKKAAMQKKMRDKLKFKWHKNLKSALKTAKKANCTCYVLYSDPAVCPPCREMDETIFDSREFKGAKGIGIGYRSTSPIKEYGLGEAKPVAVLVGPDGKEIRRITGYGGQSAEEFIAMLEQAQPVIEVPGEKASEDDAE